VRVVLVTGKGGVGKTTLATATALAAAERGARTLLVSTDAAHSLGDVLQQSLDAEPVAIAENLDGLQIDARHELARSWGTIAGYLKRLFGIAALDELRLDELVVVPGLDQLVALARLHSLAAEGAWDAMVVDCAPSADSLRLLSIPDVLNFYLAKVFGRSGTMARLGRKRIERTLALPLPDEAVLSSIDEMSSRLADLKTVLGEATTTARIVATPERMVIAEGQRTLSYLALYGYAVDAVLVNRVPPTADADRSAGRHRQVQLQDLAEAFDPIPRLFAGLRPTEPLGPERLRELGRELYAECEPLARLSSRPSMQICTSGGESMVRLFVPGARREDIHVALDAEDLVVTLGGYRRSVKLPDGLSGRRVERAGLSDQHLEVVFGGRR